MEEPVTITLPPEVLEDFPGNQLKWLKRTLYRINIGRGRCGTCGRPRDPDRLHLSKCKACSVRNVVYCREVSQAKKAAEIKAQQRKAKKVAPPAEVKPDWTDSLEDLLS